MFYFIFNSTLCCYKQILRLGKTVVCKERAKQTAELEETAKNTGQKNKANPVFFLSLLGVNALGDVEEHEHIFDIYTKEYEFAGKNVAFKSAQDLLEFYEQKSINPNLADQLVGEEDDINVGIEVDITNANESLNNTIDKSKPHIYSLVEFFIEHNSNGHFFIDECPFLLNKGNTHNIN